MKRPLNLVVCFLVPIVILLIGGIYAVTYWYQSAPRLMEEVGRGVVPSGFPVTVDKPGKYTVWLNTYTVFEGKGYEHSDELPAGAEVLIFDQGKGGRLEMNQWVLSKRKFEGQTAVSLGTFDLLKPNTVLEVRSTGIKEPVVISISPNRAGESVQVALHLVSVVAISLTLAVASLIILLHRRQRAMREEFAS